MKIVSLYNFNNQFRNKFVSNNVLLYKNQGMGDVVSFSAKQYNADSIVNPTNHCAYCGSKVYSEQQIDSIAKEILSSKYDKMQGKIRSILEKLEGAKHSEELSIAKRLENEKEIQFFKNLLEIASKKSFLKGAAIFEQVYDMDNEQALKTISDNLRPLLKTIDHVSPQNEEKDNVNSDINLVEACWCCNHDLKKGIPFIEFYTMYPSIKNNMPQEKFQAATSSILDLESNGLLQRLSAINLVKTIKRLFIQRQEANSYLDSIDFRIKNSKDAINTAIQNAQQELQNKELELAQKEQQLVQMQQDDEFRAIMERISLQKNIETIDNVISILKSKLQNTSNTINEIRNPSKKKSNKSKNKYEELTPAQQQAKVDELIALLASLREQVLERELEKEDKQTRIRILDEQFPSIAMMQYDKNQADSVVSAYNQLVKTNAEIDEKQALLADFQEQSSTLQAQLNLLPDNMEKPESFSDEIQAGYKRYIELKDALAYIIEHPNGGAVNNTIKQAAKGVIEQEIYELILNPLVVQYNVSLERSKMEKEKTSVDKNIETLKISISGLKNTQEKLEKTTALMTKDAAIQKSQELSVKMRATNDKELLTKLPQLIESIKTEILFIKSTIADLEKELSEIDSKYSLKS